MATASSASLTWGHAASASEWTAIERMPSARQARITRRAISPRLATRTLCSTSSGRLGGGGGDGLERGDPPARVGRSPAEQQRDRLADAVDAQLHQTLLADPRARDDPMPPALRAAEPIFQIRAEHDAGGEPVACPRRVALGQRLAEGQQRRG